MPKKAGFLNFISSLDDDDDSSGFDFASFAWSASHGAIDFETGSFAKGGKPGAPGGGGGGGTPTPPPPTDTYISGTALSDSQEYNVKVIFQGTWDPTLKQ